jgi:hypothetical protein
MNSQFPIRTRHAVLTIVVATPLLFGVWIASFFLLSSDAAVLRDSVLNNISGSADHKITLHAGGVTVALVRAVTGRFHVPPEPRAVLETLHSAEVGIYTIKASEPSLRRTVLAKADEAMTKRGWIRMVGAIERGNLVAIYVPERSLSLTRMKCCVLVLNEDRLVIASGSGNLQPLVSLAQNRFAADRARSTVKEYTGL